ncbi:nitrite reductase small subunit NirD [Nocardioides ferulae]|uniref:nitrite reductase small subunit NirD n=1 Tax=Nocardioides ferulae TaxID=2340821 RepID=UPI000EAD305C|nr:nitrite reductase small subunit NirD [Nocardioides ferulae]
MSAGEATAVDLLGAPEDARTWEPVCRLHDLEVEGGAAVLVRGEAVAVFRTHDDRVFALSNYDPYARASVLSRGIVGTKGGAGNGAGEERPFVASPMHKQAFDLRTGQCLDDATVRVPAYAVRVADGTVLVGPLREHTDGAAQGASAEAADEGG